MGWLIYFHCLLDLCRQRPDAEIGQEKTLVIETPRVMEKLVYDTVNEKRCDHVGASKTCCDDVQAT